MFILIQYLKISCKSDPCRVCNWLLPFKEKAYQTIKNSKDMIHRRIMLK